MQFATEELQEFYVEFEDEFTLFSRFTRTCSEAINKHTQNDLN
jgi:hypothetical protein